MSEYALNQNDLSRLPFGGELKARRDSILSQNYLEAHIYHLAQNYLAPNITQCTVNNSSLSERLVLHLRTEDVANLAHNFYFQNPLCYYRWLSSLHPNLIIVTEPGWEHILYNEILGLFQTVDLLSGSVIDDFQQLRSARFLATSGVSTFPMAAALLSNSLDTLYCSNVYL